MIVSDNEYIDFSTVPQSKGIGKFAIVLTIVGIICIFIVGGLAAHYSGFGHVWPSMKTLRIDLGSMTH